MNRQQGFTLIEIMLAMLLLSIVMYLGSLSFSIFSQRWQQDMGSFTTEVNQARKFQLLQTSVNGISAYIVHSERQQPVYFFSGNSQQMWFITGKAIFEPEYQALVRLSITELPSGQQQLLYQESPFHTQPLFKDNVLPEPQYSMVILTEQNIRFNYFGWESQQQRNDSFENRNIKPQWNNHYQASVSGMLPFALNIIWADNEPVIFPLPSDQGNKIITTNERQNDA